LNIFTNISPVSSDSLSTIISALYCKFMVVLGIAFPVTEILCYQAPPSFYQGFYLYLYLVSVAFVLFMYTSHLRTNAAFSMIDSYCKFLKFGTSSESNFFAKM
jgi:hypothetical protein